jgi:uncharacterized protein DUF3857/transglutaminase superfamily protein
LEGLIFNHYVRVKIYTDRGKETQSKIQIPFGKFFGTEIKIQDIAARTIKPDGTVVDLKKEDVFESTQVKSSGAKIKVKSFVVPAIEPGVIVDYRWREIRVRASANYLRLQFQRDIPARLVKYLIKPYPYAGYGMRAQTFHGINSPFVKEKNGFYSTTMSNMPAFAEEGSMPPEDQVRTWMLLYYTREEKSVPEKFWKDWGKELYDLHKSDIKVNDEIRKASAEGVGDAATPDGKLERLYNYTREKVKNINDDALGLTPEERAKAKENKSPSDTLKRGKGTSEDIDMLFAALAIAAGLDARVVELPDRSDFFFNEGFADGYFLRLHAVAVQLDGKWQFYDPANAYCPIGMLPWWKEGVKALILDQKEPIWTTTPISPPDKSLETRTGKFSLLEDGSLEGHVRIEYTGQLGIEKKEENDDDSPAQREDTLKEAIKKRMSTAELSEIKIENVTDPVKPFTYSYHVRVPGYAQRTGKRIFFQPGVFSHGAGSLFPSSTRKYEIYFHYPWAEKDHITIDLPAGFALDNAEQPGSITPEMCQQVCRQDIKIGSNGRVLVYDRNFFFGARDNILFPVASYAAIKRLFDVMNQMNEHTITLKQSATN